MLRVAFAILVCGAASASAQTLTPTMFSSAPACVPGRVVVPLVEWDLPQAGDAEPGAITVDVQSSSSDPSRVWFVTRQGDFRLFRFTPGHNWKFADAVWRSWSLDAQGLTTGGLKKIKPSKDKRNVFIRSALSVQQLDSQCKPKTGTNSCTAGLTVFRDRPDPFISDPAASDLAIDDFNNVYSTSPDDVRTETFVAYVQKLTPSAVRPATSADRTALGNPSALFVTNVTRWEVAGGAGLCNQALSELGPCLAGIDVDDKNQHLVYYSDSVNNLGAQFDNIAELNTKTTYGDNVRFWSLVELSDKLGETITDPRQMKVERENGKTVVWVVTGSGHVVRLIPQSGSYALASAHLLRDALNDPFGLALDGDSIGYTAVAQGIDGGRLDKVGMVLPKDRFVQLKTFTKMAPQSKPLIAVDKLDTETLTNNVKGNNKKAPGRVDQNTQGDTFVDGFINQATQPPGKLPSMRPLGITPDFGHKVGAFFYAVGTAGDLANPALINRIGLAMLPQVKKHKHGRDDDDHDGDGKKNKWEDDDDDDDGKPNHMDRDDDDDCRDDDLDDDDDDNDGIEDKWDDSRKRENRTSAEHTTAPAGFTDHQVVVNPGTTLVIAQATASDLGTPMRIEILDPLGLKVASPLATPGVAVATLVPLATGTYTVRVFNLGLTAATLTTDLLVQDPWPVLAPLLP